MLKIEIAWYDSVPQTQIEAEAEKDWNGFKESICGKIILEGSSEKEVKALEYFFKMGVLGGIGIELRRQYRSPRIQK